MADPSPGDRTRYRDAGVSVPHRSLAGMRCHDDSRDVLVLGGVGISH